MAIQRVRVRAKTRTRQHVIADMSFNHLERYVLECGYTAEPFLHDYGYDVSIHTYKENGELEPGRILAQLKATDRLKVLKDGKTISARVDRRDLKTWLRELVPVILIVYDARTRRGYWQYMQRYFENVASDKLAAAKLFANESVTVHIPTSNRLNRRAIAKFARFLREVLP